MKKLAIIGAGRMACIFAQNAREMGVKSYCFAWVEGAIAKKYVDYFYPISIFEKEQILDKCREIEIDGVVATTELTIAVASYISNNMGLNGNSLLVSESITDKYRNRELTKHIVGLSHPKYIEVDTVDEILASDLNYPIILKPTNKGGKKGISVVYTQSDVKTAFKYAINEVGNNVHFIVEEYIEGGQEYSVESLTYHGETHVIQITEKVSSGAPHCVELGHHQPGNITAENKEKVTRILKEALKCIGIENGPCHTEIKIRNNEVYLIEFNARPGGDHIAYPLTDMSTGYEYIKGIIKVSFDQDPMVNESTFVHHFAGVLFVTEQTKFLKPLFDKCEEYEWCYKKNKVSDELSSLLHNDGYNTNYMMYYSKKGRPIFEKLIECVDEVSPILTK